MKIKRNDELKDHIIRFGRILWDKDLVGGLNGNISLRVDHKRFLITGTGTCLGGLKRSDIVLLGVDGKVVGSGIPSSEKLLHLEIFKMFPSINAVIHTHTTYTNAFFLRSNVFLPSTFEGAYTLGKVYAVPQGAINVTNAVPVVERLKENRVVVLRRHGVVSMGEDLFECFMRVQGLEEQIKVEVIGNLFQMSKKGAGVKRGSHG